jgi:phenylacetate-CoA ligase
MTLTPLGPWIARKIGQPALHRADLEVYQLQKLRETIHWARAHSPFYRRQLAEAPPELASLDALAGYPFTTTADLRANPLQFLSVSQDDIHRVVTLESSGTCGAPKRFYFTLADQALTVDFFQVGMSTFTAPGDRVLILLPGETPGSVGNLLAQAVRRLGAEPIQHGPVRDPARTLAVAAQERVTVMVGVPTHVMALVRQAPPCGSRASCLLPITFQSYRLGGRARLGLRRLQPLRDDRDRVGRRRGLRRAARLPSARSGPVLRSG